MWRKSDFNRCTEVLLKSSEAQMHYGKPRIPRAQQYGGHRDIIDTFKSI